MKILLTILTLFLTQTLFAQKVDTTRVLDLIHKSDYKEMNQFRRDGDIVLQQEVSYNDPNVIDDEYSQTLSIRISDSAVKAGRRSFDLTNDSTMVKCTYDRLSVWNWSKKSTMSVGQFKIVSITRKTITIVFDLTVTEQGKAVYIYQGKRIFRKSKSRITTTDFSNSH